MKNFPAGRDFGNSNRKPLKILLAYMKLEWDRLTKQYCAITDDRRDLYFIGDYSAFRSDQ